MNEETRTLLTFTAAAVSLLWRLLSEQKLWTPERWIFIAGMYTIAYVTGLQLLRKAVE